jgi:hypothetical protein
MDGDSTLVVDYIYFIIENERKLETIIFFEWCREHENYENEQ